MEAIPESTYIKVYDLRCEYQLNPIGIDVLHPRLSWKLATDQPGTVQTAYQLKVWDEKGDLWDSGKISSDQSIHVPYDGPALGSGQRCYWQVRVWDGANQPSEWSEDPAWWEMGLLNTTDWHSKWIEPGWDEDPALFNPAPFLRTSFSTGQAQINSARIYVSAHGLYELYLNGERVGDAYFTPGFTSYHHRLGYQTYDVTAYLQHHGENVIGAILGDGWYRGKIGARARRNVYGEHLGLLLQLRLRYTDGREEFIVSDENWQATTGPILKSDLQDGEIYDARLNMPGWNRSGFEVNDWTDVRVADYSLENLVAATGPLVRRKEVFQPLSVLTTPAGETVVDMGQNFSGIVQLTVSGPAGTAVTLRHGETLDKAGNFTMENLALPGTETVRQEVQYTLKGEGVETYTPHFTTMGFRYVKVEGWPGTPNTSNFQGIAVYSDLGETGSFECSNPLINQLQHNILWSQKSNFMEIPTDCPTRERAGWTGDAQIFARTGSFLMDTVGFLRKWLKDLAAEQDPNGRVRHMAPDYPDEVIEMLTGSAGWGDAATIVPWTLYQVFGDSRILSEQYKSMKSWVSYQQSQSHNYLWDSNFHWGEWIEPDAPSFEQLAMTMTPAEITEYMHHTDVATAYFAHSASLLARTAEVLGKKDEAREYHLLHENIKQAYVNAFVEPNGKLKPDKQASYVRALAFDLLPEQLRPLAAGRLAELIRQADTHLATGFLSTPLLCHVLAVNGYLDLAYDLLLQDTPPSWLYQVKKGATTIWEDWHGIDEAGNLKSSFNHYSLGSVGSWLYQVVAGLELGVPGYKHIKFQPQPGGGLSYARATYQSLYGEIESRWQLEEGDKFRLSVKVPANARATIVIPTRLGRVESVNGYSIETIKGVTEVRQEPDSTFIEVGSGSYTLISRLLIKGDI